MNNTTCTFCTDIVNIISDDIKISNDTIQEVTKILNITCYFLPSIVQKKRMLFHIKFYK